MRCKRLEHEVIQLAYGELEPGRASVVQAHVNACPACSKVHGEHGLAAQGIKALPEAPAATLASERLKARILSEELAQRAPANGRLATAAAAAFGIAAALVAINVLQSENKLAGAPAEDNRLVSVRDYGDLPEPHEISGRLLQGISDSKATPHESSKAVQAAGGGQSKNGNRRTYRRIRPGFRPADLDLSSPDAPRASVSDAAKPSKAGKQVVVILPGTGSATETRLPNGLAIGG